MRFALDERIVLAERLINKVIFGTLDTESIAAKTCDVDDLLEKEANFLERCKHKNVVGFRGSMRVGDHRYLIMEFAQGGDLYRHLEQNKFTTALKRSIVEQISSGLEHIHSLGILHKDIKAQNILSMDLDFRRVVISDFAMAQDYDATLHERNNHGLVPGNEEYTYRSDIFLLGLLAFQIFMDRKNVGGKNIEIEAFLDAAPEQVIVRLFPKEVWRAAIIASVSWQPERRPTAAVFRRAFSE